MASLATTPDFRAFTSPRHGAGREEARARLFDAARTARAERVIRLVFARRAVWAHLSETLVHALERLPKIASRDWPNVDRALAQLACGELDDAFVGDGIIRSVLAVATPDSPGFDGELSRPMRVRWRDVITPQVRAVAFDPATPGVLRVRLHSNIETELTVDDPRVVPAPRIPFAARSVNLIPGWTFDTYSWLGDVVDSSTLETPSLVEQVTDLATTLATAAPEYLEWVGQVMADILPISAPDGQLRSRTNPLLPGRVTATFPRPALAIGELLVHEASHLHADLARELGPLDDGSDTTLYWSPARKMGRPIERVLFAFHAWANIGAFYETCLERNEDLDGYAEQNLSIIQRQANEMRESLEKSPALTDLGRALWTPFCE